MSRQMNCLCFSPSELSTLRGSDCGGTLLCSKSSDLEFPKAFSPSFLQNCSLSFFLLSVGCSQQGLGETNCLWPKSCWSWGPSQMNIFIHPYYVRWASSMHLIDFFDRFVIFCSTYLISDLNEFDQRRFCPYFGDSKSLQPLHILLFILWFYTFLPSIWTYLSFKGVQLMWNPGSISKMCFSDLLVTGWNFYLSFRWVQMNSKSFCWDQLALFFSD